MDGGSPRRHRVLVVDHQALPAELMARALEHEPDLDCAGIATDAPAALAVAAHARPDTVLLDMQLPSMDGLELMARLRALLPGLRVIVLTAYPRLDRERAALESGAVGFLGKDSRLADVLAALRGATARHPARDLRLVTRSGAAPTRRALSPREQQVLELLAAGNHAHDIADVLGLSVHTARGHVKSILSKLGAHSQLEAVAVASREGLVRVGA